jgi:hypothetical protein
MKDKLLPKTKFPLILGFSALLIALCAAFFSVYGISTLFAGAAISAMIMASSLEIGKLVGTTFLYRYWHKCTRILKFYLTTAILVLMVVTSLGIFGYLSAAYQKSSIEFGVTQERIKNTEAQKPYLQDKIVAAKKRIDDLSKLRSSQDNQISTIITNDVITRNPLALKQLQQQTMDSIADTDKSIKEENTKIQTTIDDIQKLDDKINEMKLGTASKKDVQTFKFVADALGMTLDNVARWFIISLIFVFDPLAICLILAYNVAVYRIEDEDVYDKTPIIESTPEEKVRAMLNETPKSPSKEEPIITPKVEEKPQETPKPSHGNGFFSSYFKR